MNFCYFPKVQLECSHFIDTVKKRCTQIFRESTDFNYVEPHTNESIQKSYINEPFRIKHTQKKLHYQINYTYKVISPMNLE
jgi:chemotaxis methyl-accepting protein methylase